jgi:hypothetical protein
VKKWFGPVFLVVLCILSFSAFGQSASNSGGWGWGNNIPALSTMSPNSAVAGALGFSMTVNGSNFCPKCVVRWNGSRRPTTIISSSQAVVTIYKADIAQAGQYSVVMFSPQSGNQSNALPFTAISGATSPTVSVAVAPTSTTLQCGKGQQFSANASATWSASGGTINSAGMYTAPTSPGSYVVTATSVANPLSSGQAVVTVINVALQSASLNPTAVTGGQASMGTVTLNTAAPSGGVTVNLSSNNAAAQVPTSVTVPANTTSASFNVSTSTVSTTTPVTITASYNGASPTAVLTVNPVVAVVALQSASVNPTRVTGGQGSIGAVTLNTAAPSGGVTVNLSSNNVAAQVPPSVTVPANSTSTSFNVSTSTVSTTTPVTITASYNGASPTAILTVNPVVAVVALQSASVNPTTVTGGQGSIGAVTLNMAAPSGGVTVNLSSNNAAAQVPTSVTVPANSISTSFNVSTSTVSTTTPATITASYNGASPTATLTVNPVTAPIQHTVTLSWSASTSTVTGYNIYRTTISGGPYTQVNTALESALNYVDNTVQSGQTYYYVATSVDSSGQDSGFSNQVSATIPVP